MDAIATAESNSTNSTLERLSGWKSFMAVGILGSILQALPIARGRDAWIDEMFTLNAVSGDWGTFWREVSADIHPPLYYVYLKLFDPLGFIGSPWYFRLVTLFIWPILVYAVFRFVKAKPFLRGVALVALAVLATSPLAAFQFSELRMYGLSMALAFFLTVMALAAVHPKSVTCDLRFSVAFGVISGLLLLTSYANVFVLVGLYSAVAYFAPASRPEKAKAGLFAGASALVTLIPFGTLIARDFASSSVPYDTSLSGLVRYSYLAVGMCGVLLLLIRRKHISKEVLFIATSAAISVVALAAASAFRGEVLANPGIVGVVLTPSVALLIGCVVAAEPSRLIGLLGLVVALNAAIAVLVQAEPHKLVEPNRLSLVSDIRAVINDGSARGDSPAKVVIVEWALAEESIKNSLQSEFPRLQYVYVPRRARTQQNYELVSGELTDRSLCTLVFARPGAGLLDKFASDERWDVTPIGDRAFEICPAERRGR